MLRGISFCCFGALATVLLALSPLGQQFENRVGLGLLYAVRGNLKAPDGALVVGLDRPSVSWLQRNVAGLDDCITPRALEELGRARNVNQLPRALYVCLLRRLAERAPRLVVFDINFNAETLDDDVFAGAIEAAGNVLLLERIEHGDVVRRLAPATVLSEAAMGTVFFQTDGTARRVATGYPTHDRHFPDIPSLPVSAWVHAGGEAAPAMPAFQPIWLYGPADTIPMVPIRRIIEATETARPGDLAGVTVFVGASEAADRSAYDHFKVPLLGAKAEIMSGVELAATAFLNLVHGERLRSLPPAAWAGVVFCHALVTLLVARRLGGQRALLGVVLISGAYSAAVVVLFVAGQIRAPLAVPLLIVTPVAMLAAFSARFAVAQRLVERLTPRPFARELLARAGVGLGESRVEDATIMFADIVGSTALAEQLGETAFWTIMNGYYAAATTAVEANGGVVVEYMGDGILALFTSAVAGPDHAARACRTAQQISDEVRHRPHRFSGGADRQASPDRTSYSLRFGIHSGSVMTGSAGADSRFSYKAIGESVIIAARLEEHGRTLPQDGADVILLSDDTRRLAALSEGKLRSLGSTRLRGRSTELEIFLLLPHKV